MAQQAPMYMAMMQGMMGWNHPAVHLAMMQQMASQAYMHSPEQLQLLQEWQKQRLAGTDKVSSSKPQHGEGEDTESTSSVDSRKDKDAAKFPPHPATMGAMSTMWPPGPPSTTGASSVTVEAFLAENHVDPDVADRLRALAPHRQQDVIRRGSVSGSWNPSVTLKSRICRVEHDYGSGFSGSAFAIHDEKGSWPARRSVKATIEGLIRDYNLSPGCAWMLRALPPDKQKLAARIDPSGQADTSGYVADQLQEIV